MKKLKNTTNKLIAALLSASLVFSLIVVPAQAGDTWPFKGESAHGENQSSVHGYTSGQIMDWSPESDPGAELMRSHVPLQQRISAFAQTQANPLLNPNVKMFDLAGDYGNAFIENAPYTNKFAQYHLNFWQYIDYYSPWHGMATAYTPPEYYDDLAQSNWQQKWFEFGFLNIPNPTYTDAAHKNGVLSLGGTFFSNNDRGQQTNKQMLVKDENGKYTVAEKMVEMAKYYGYDGYFFNQEEIPNVATADIPDYIAFLKVFQKAGLYVQWYDSLDTTSGENSFARQIGDSNISMLYDKNTNEKVTNSFFFDYGVGSYQIDSSNTYLNNLNSTYGTSYNIFDVGFAGLEAGRDRFRNSFSGKLGADGVPATSIATLGADFVHAGLDEDMLQGWPVSHRAENDYQWMTTIRERLWWSGPNQDPKNTATASQSNVSDVYVGNMSWTGVASAIAERSVIGGTNFYTNFNTGHGLSYFADGQVSNNDEWSNMSLQDIPVTWQWWQDTTGNKLEADFDYGSEYTMTGNTKNRFSYQKIGGYNGGSSLVVNGKLTAEDFLRLYKTELSVKASSKVSITYNKPSNDDTSTMSVGLIFKDAPETVVKVPVIDSGKKTTGWTTAQLDLSAYDSKTIAALGLVFDNGGVAIDTYQMNIGQVRIFDGSAIKPTAPTGLAINNAFTNSNEMNIKWDMDTDYSKVKQYNIYINNVYVGGKYDSMFYIKKTPAKSGTIKVVPVGADGTEGDAATLAFNLDKAVSEIKVDSKEDGTFNVSWTNPVSTAGDITVKVKSVNLALDKTVSDEMTVTAGSTSAPFTGMPINGDDFIVTINIGNNDSVSYSGNFIDKVCEQYTEKWSLDGDKINLPMPNTRDWHYMYVYEDGVAKQFATTYNQGNKPMIIRGRSTKECLSFTSTAKTVSVVMEDYAGNKSAPLIVKSSTPIPETAAPQIIPAIQQWTEGSGSFTITAASRIVLDSNYATELQNSGQTFSDDLKALTGWTIPIITADSANDGDIYLKLGESDSSIGNEGYVMTVGNSVTISAKDNPGAFYGTRTLLQIFKQNKTINGCTIRDWSKTKWRAIMVDVGRKYMSVDWLKQTIKDMSYLKMNMLHLHLADASSTDGGGFRLESSSHPEVVSTQHYTKQEIKDIVDLAAKYQITVLPEIDLPGHADWAYAEHSDLMLNQKVLGNQYYAFDLSKNETYTFMKDILDEYIPLFPGPYWHLGADEYMFLKEYDNFPQLTTWAKEKYGQDAHAVDSYRHFVNWSNDIVKSYGKTMWAWNDVLLGVGVADAGVCPVDKDIYMDHWEASEYLGWGGVFAEKCFDRGQYIMNSNAGLLYYVLGKDWKTDPKKIYDTFKLNVFSGGEYPVDSPLLLGAKMEIWCDFPQAETEQQVAKNTFESIRSLAQVCWNSPKQAEDYTTFKQIIYKVMRAPGAEELQTPTPPPQLILNNVSVNKTVTASSVESGTSFIASNAVDGDFTSRWASNNTDNEWLQVDLGKVYDINRVKLSWEPAYAKGYKIQVSTDGSSWNDVYTTISSDGGIDDIPFAAVNARYVKMQATKKALSGYGCSIFEFEVAGVPTDNVVKPISKDSTIIGASGNGGTNETKDKSLDGDEATKWCIGDAKSGWLAIDLGKDYEVNRWRTVHGEKGDKDPGFNTKKFALEVLKDKNATAEQLKDSSYLADAKNWTEVECVDNSTNKAMVVDNILGTVVLGRYFRMRIDESCINQYTAIRIHEFQLYGQVPDTTAPAEVTKSTVGAGDGQLTIKWTDPADMDFDHVIVTGAGIAASNVNKGTQSVTISGLVNGTEYTITLMTVDAKGNASTGISVIGTPKVVSASDTCVSENVAIIGASQDGNTGETKEKALDGDELTKWCHGGNTGWLAIDLGTDYEISRWRTVNGEKGDKDPGFNTEKFALEVLKDKNATMEQLKDSSYLADAKNWTEVELVDNSIDKAMVVDHMLGTTVTGRYFKLRIDDSCINQYTAVRIHEFQLYGQVPDSKAPAEVTVPTVTAGDGQLTITWTDPADIDFDYVIVTGAGITAKNISKGTQSATITGLANGTEYTLTLKTVDMTGNASTGVIVNGTPSATVIPDTTAPAEVTVPTVTAGDEQLTITWTDPADVDFDYVIVTGAGITLQNIGKGLQKAVITGLENGKTYDITLKTVDATGNPSTGVTVNGTPSATVVPDTTAPTEVAGAVVSAGDGQLTITWIDPADVDFDHVIVTGAGITVPNVNKGAQKVIISGLANGTEYTVTLKTVDAKGNPSTGVDVKGTPKAVIVTQPSSSTTSTPAPEKIKVVEDIIKIIETPKLDTVTGVAAATPILEENMKKALENAKVNSTGIKTVTVEIPKVTGAKAYSVELPKSILTSDAADIKVKVVTEIGTIMVPSNMFKAVDVAGANSIVLNLGIADTSRLNVATKEKIGNRPVINLEVKVNGKKVEWNNPDAPVTVSIPYSPTPEELKNSEHIVVWYVNDKGEVTPISNGKYTAETGMVTFTTTHFSKYAIAYVNKTYTDVTDKFWGKNAIEVMASKGVIEGTSDMAFSPNKSITRGEFISWLVKTLGLTTSIDSNFVDVESTDACYIEVGVAKALGITAGVGNNKYSPDTAISRQDMMVLTIKAMKIAKITLPAANQSDIKKFEDSSKVASYALENVAAMVKSGIVSGDGKNLNPISNITRAEATQILYKVYNMIQ